MNNASQTSPACTQMDMAEAAKHTPGPWHTDRTSYTFVVESLNPSADRFRNGRRVATLSITPFAKAAAEGEANARLIAAAPDLLAALRAAIGALEFSRDFHSDLGNEDQAFAQDQLDVATAAIAKATSQQPTAASLPRQSQGRLVTQDSTG